MSNSLTSIFAGDKQQNRGDYMKMVSFFKFITLNEITDKFQAKITRHQKDILILKELNRNISGNFLAENLQ